MTREEAIELLCAYGVPQDEKRFQVALDMAIEALSKPKVAYACDSRRCGADCCGCGRTTDIKHAKNFTKICDSYLEKLHTEPSDLISRADAIEAVCHNCAYYTDAQCKTDSGYWCESGAMIREDIPSADAVEVDRTSEWVAVRREEYEDLIANAVPTVIRAKTFMRKEDFDKWAEDIKKQGENIICIPCDAEVVSADTVQGEWKNRGSKGWAMVDFAYCSNCGQPIIHKHASPLWRFCPICGARMIGGAEE